MNISGNSLQNTVSMRERLEMVKGSFTVESSPGKGTTVIARIPFTTGVKEARTPVKPQNRIKVLLADDHGILREGLRKLLESESDIEVVGEASNGHQALALSLELRPDVVVMDIAMPQLNGLEATRQIRRALPETKVLILSAHSDDAYVEGVIDFGATGYLIKQTSAHFLSEAIREVAKGNTFFSSSIDKRHLQRHQKVLDRKGGLKTKNLSLTSREMEVLQQVAEGEANKQIADSLGISIKTVEKHRQNVMKKLNIHDTAGLTRYAISTGIIENSLQIIIIEPDVPELQTFR